MPRDAYLEHRILAADPVELIHILYEHTLAQMASARSALAAGDIAGRAQAIARTLAALGELEGSLNHEAGGSISQNLGRLYRYMRKRVTDGNVKRDDAALAEVESLLKTLAEGWSAMQHATSAKVAPHAYESEAQSDMRSWCA